MVSVQLYAFCKLTADDICCSSTVGASGLVSITSREFQKVCEDDAWGDC